MSPPGRRFKCLTLREKLDIINAVNNGIKRKAIMAQYQVPASTLSCLLRQRDQLLKKMGDREVCPSTKRIRAVDSPELEEKMKAFVAECRRKEVALRGNIMLAKAREFALTLGLTNFRASNGWLYNFKKRHGICLRKDKFVISLSKADQSCKTVNSRPEECNSTVDEHTESTIHLNQESNPIDEDLVAVTEPLRFERDALKIESLDNDAPTDYEYDSRTDEYNFDIDKFDNAAGTIKSCDKASETDVEFINTAISTGGRGEDEFDSFGRYIASALRALPGRVSIVARNELQNTLSRVQMTCVKT